MGFDAGSAFSEALDRITTQVALILIGCYAAASVVQTAALQDIMRELILEVREAVRNEGTAEEYREIVDATDPVLNDLPLALGLDFVPAIVLLLIALLAATAVIALAIDAFAKDASSTDDLDTAGLLVHTINLFVGGIVYFVLLAIGFALVFVPGLIVLVLLAFYPVAIVVEDQNFVSAFSSSIGTVTDNVGQTLLLVLLAIVVGIVGGVLSSIVTAVASGTVGGIVSTVITAAATVLVLAMLTRAYVAAHPVTEDAGASESTTDAL